MKEKSTRPPPDSEPVQPQVSDLSNSTNGTESMEDPKEELLEPEIDSEESANPASAYLVVILVLIAFAMLETWWAYQDLKQRASPGQVASASSSAVISSEVVPPKPSSSD